MRSSARRGLKKKKQTNKQTSEKYTCFQKTVLLFQLSQKITISKVVLYISEYYNQQSRSLHLKRSRSAKTQSRRKPKEREIEKEGEGEKRGGKE